MDPSEQKLNQLIENQNRLIDIENYNYYQYVLQHFYNPCEERYVQTMADWHAFRVELRNDWESAPPFANAPITKYHDSLSRILDDFITEGKHLAKQFPQLSKKLKKIAIKFITTLESIKNTITETIFITRESDGELLKNFEKADKTISDLVKLTRAIIEDISKEMAAINVRLGRDYTKFSA